MESGLEWSTGSNFLAAASSVPQFAHLGNGHGQAPTLLGSYGH